MFIFFLWNIYLLKYFTVYFCPQYYSCLACYKRLIGILAVNIYLNDYLSSMQQELCQQHSGGSYALYSGIIICYGWQSKTYFSVL